MQIGIFGGTFNPIHYGHLRTAEEVREARALDRILFVPSGNPPLKTYDLPDASHRYEMVRRAIASNASFALSDIETGQQEKSYSVTTLQKLHHLFPGDHLFFILGTDAFLDMPNWWQPERLIELTDFIVVTRPGFPAEEVKKSPYLRELRRGAHEGMHEGALTSGRALHLVRITQLDIASTEIRARIREGKSIKYLLPESVEEYIYTNKLYT